MASNFSSLRSARKAALDKLAQAVKQEAQKGSADERFWKLSVDQKTGVGYAKIRFLPAPKGEELPWVRLFSHGFQGPSGTYYIENCPTTLNLPCPACKENNVLWSTGAEDKRNIARDRKRKLSFISNILVLEDPAHPENVGKVFLFKYGKKIHDKIMELIEPQFPDQQPANPFDLWEGADFKLKAAKVAGFQNYDKSSFSDPSALFDGDDDKLESVWEKEYQLAEFVAPAAFKKFEELETRLNAVLNGTNNAPKTAEAALQTDMTDEDIEKVVETAKKEEVAKQPKKPAAKKATPKPEPKPEVAADPDEDEIRGFFADVLGDDE